VLEPVQNLAFGEFLRDFSPKARGDFSRRAFALRGRKRKIGAGFGKNRQKGVRN
jgi:hypothetical protein